MAIKLAELLLRRKELAEKVELAKQVKIKDLFDTKIKRISVSESTDEVTADVPKLTLSQVTAEYNHYARQLRAVDAAIQQTNWTTEVDLLASDVMVDYVEGS